MKMQKRLLSILIIAVTLFLLVVAFTSCKKCDHEWQEWTVTKPATCLEAGEKVRVCKHDSSHIETKEIEKLPHTFEDYTITVQPTCVINGTMEAVCTTQGCNAISVKMPPQPDHTWVGPEHFDGDCINPAYDKYVCSAEGCTAEKIEKVVNEDTGTATGKHTYGDDWICSVCNAAHPVTAEYDIAETGKLTAKVYAKEELNPATGKYKNVYYLVIVGSGSMRNDYTPDTLPWAQYARRIEKIQVDNDIASLGNYAFSNLTALTNVALPSGIGVLPEGLFYGSQITDVIIPSGVFTIEASAFEGCTKLKTVTFANGSNLSIINRNAFYGCSAIESISLPEGVEYIGNSAFAACSKLASINLSENALEIASDAFDNTSFRPKDGASEADINAAFINYFEGGEYLPIGSNNYAIFLGIDDKLEASIRSLVLHKDVVAIAYGALDGANNLEFISVQSGNSKFAGIQNCIIETETKTLVLGIQSSSIPNDGTVNKIGKYAFLNCVSLKKIVIPESILEIEASAFNGCSSLEEISVPFTGLSKAPASDNSRLFYTIFGDPENVPATLATVKITNATDIYTLAFEGCNNIKNIYLPTTLQTVGYSAFLGCTMLESVYVDSIDFWFSVDFKDTYSNPFGYANNLYVNGELLETLVVPENITEIAYCAFAGCDSIKTIQFHNNLKTIANSAFKDCSSLEEIVIPNSVDTIGAAAFANCSSLVKVTLSSQLDTIPANLFIACTSLEQLDLGLITKIDTTAFLSCLSLSQITVSADNANYATKDGILYNKDLSAILFIPHAIDGTVEISDKITAIDSGLFGTLPELDELIIPDSVTSIGKDALKGCTTLKSITLPFIGESIESKNTFSYIFGTVPSSLKTVVIKQATVIKDGEFAECNNLREVYLPEGVTSIGAGAFKNCYTLTSIIIPASVTEIKDGAFEGCVKLYAVYFGFNKSVSDIEDGKADNIAIAANNVAFNNARKYYNNSNVVEENEKGYYWYFDEKNEIATW